MTEAIVWYDKGGIDPARPWLIKRGDVVTRCRAFEVGADYDNVGGTVLSSDFRAEGFMECQPGGPRGILRVDSDSLGAIDEVPVTLALAPEPAPGP